MRWHRENQYEVQPTDRPVWDSITLTIAGAVREGLPVARVPLPLPLSAMEPESPLIGDWLDKLQKDISTVKVELLNAKAQEKSDEYLQRQGRRLLEMGREMLHRKAGGETLYAAMDAFLRWVDTKYVDVEKRPTQFG